jgi:hypothetical protein
MAAEALPGEPALLLVGLFAELGEGLLPELLVLAEAVAPEGVVALAEAAVVPLIRTWCPI